MNVCRVIVVCDDTVLAKCRTEVERWWVADEYQNSSKQKRSEDFFFQVRHAHDMAQGVALALKR